jgi:hypothetical protein
MSDKAIKGLGVLVKGGGNMFSDATLSFAKGMNKGLGKVRDHADKVAAKNRAERLAKKAANKASKPKPKKKKSFLSGIKLTETKAEQDARNKSRTRR